MTSKNVAILVSNGFNEKEFIMVQKKLRALDMNMHVISANQGLVNGWDDNQWGHNYAVDVKINEALGVDYDALVIISGYRSHEKFMTTAHTKRFISSIMMANKPVIAIDNAFDLMKKLELADDSIKMGMETNIFAGALDNKLLSHMENMLINYDDMKQAA